MVWFYCPLYAIEEYSSIVFVFLDCPSVTLETVKLNSSNSDYCFPTQNNRPWEQTARPLKWAVPVIMSMNVSGVRLWKQPIISFLPSRVWWEQLQFPLRWSICWSTFQAFFDRIVLKLLDRYTRVITSIQFYFTSSSICKCCNSCIIFYGRW